jgi:NTE family protein
LYLFGEDGGASILDAVLASSAFPGGFPPVQHGRWQYTDGGVIANVPVSVAIAKGATTIYALDVAYTGGVYGQVSNVVDVFLRVASIMLYQDLQTELAHAARQPGVTLHHIIIKGVPRASDFDFDHGPEMVDVGYARVQRYVDREAIEGGLELAPGAEEPEAVAPPPPGARLWQPRSPWQSP